MSDITPMAAVPSEVNYGRIRANFVAFIADDNGNVLEEVPLEGNVILTPTVGVLRFPSTSPPRTAVIQTLQCPVIGGILYPPGTPLGGPFPSQTGVAAVASDQPAGLPTTVQWTASFSLENTSAQPNPVTFEVPSGGVVDLTTVMPATPEPGIVVVVSTESRDRAEAAAATATQKATAAASSATAAATSATNAATSASAAASSASNAASSAGSINWAGLSGKPAVIAAGATAAEARTAIGAAEQQDTGWRALTGFIREELVTQQTTAIRRVGDRVTVEGSFKLSTPLTVNVGLDTVLSTAIPLGFRLRTVYTYVGSLVGTAFNIPAQVRDGNAISLVTPTPMTLPATSTVFFAFSWMTNNAWPSTLPGTPA